MARPTNAPSVPRWPSLLGLLGVLAWTALHHEDAGSTETPPAAPQIPAQTPTKVISSQKLDRARPEAQKQALEDFLAGRPFVLMADGKAQRFTASLSEVVVSDGPAEKRLRKLPPQPDTRHLLEAAHQAGGGKTKLVLYPLGQENKPWARHFFGSRILVKTEDRAATLTTLNKHGLRLLSEPDYSPGSMIVEPVSGGPESVFRALSILTDAPGTVWAGPLLGRQHAKELVPNDSLFAQQWWLRNTGQSGGKAGTDMRVENVWNTYKGNGIRIAIVDDGMDLLHSDLSPNVDSANHYDWNDLPYDTDPQARPSSDVEIEDNHGTAVSGMVAARGNNSLGVSGVAPEATLVGFRLLSLLDADGTDDEEDADAMARGNDIIDIKNNSWGSGAPAEALVPAGPLMEDARRQAAETGRGGKGTIFVWAAGNGREGGEQGQKDGYANSMFVTTVAGVNNKGTLAKYSEGGSHVVVSAPTSGGSGTLSVYTTDLRGNSGYNRTGTGGQPSSRDYTSSFGGTSAATPAVSGAIALMLDANPGLNWRDVKEILLRTSEQLPAPGQLLETGWVKRHGGDPSLPLIKHHEMYGGGLINTQEAVTMAENWESLGPMISSSRDYNIQRSIPDNNTAGINAAFDFSNLGLMRVEHATLRLNALHAWRGDLEITLTSPSGTVSKLATREFEDNGRDYGDWVFSSVRHWGEAGAGVWTLTIKDLDPTVTGTLLSATLTLHGTDASPAPKITAHSTGPYLLRAGDPLALTADGTGGRVAFIWSRGSTQISGNTKTLNIPAISAGQGGSYRVTAYNGATSQASADIPVGVVGPQPAAITFNQDGTLSLSANASGPGLGYQWKHNGANLSDGVKPDGGSISGANAVTLTISHLQAEEAGNYSCVVSMAGVVETIETNTTVITIAFKPEVATPTFGNGVRGTSVSIQLTASNSPSSFLVTGLPAGVTYSKTTGIVSGRPTKPGNYLLTISATNGTGIGPAVQYPWVIEEFPAAAIGTWQGITDRNTDMNQLLGGRFKVVISSTGSYSGSLTFGAKSKSWSGYINAQPGGGSQTVTFSIPMGTGLAPLAGSFTLDLTNKAFTGSYSDGRTSATTDFSGALAAWSSKNKPVTASTVYNGALELPVGLVGSPQHPQGTSYVALSLSTSGIVTWAGKLADGTAITGSSPLGKDGQTCYHALLYSKTGSSQGWAGINVTSTLVDGSVDWFKAVQKTTVRSYQAGIPLHSLTLRGARYTKPATGILVLGLTPPASTKSTDPNARLTFTSAPLSSALEQLFQVTATNAIKMPSGITLNPKSVRLTLNTTKGLLSGGFTLKDSDPLDITPPFATVTRAPSYYGLIVPHPDINKGVGFFNLAELADETGEKNTTTKIISGRVEVTPPP